MRPALLRLDRLEDREVPAATMVTDFHGIWGSYPLNLTVSGNTLFFSADDGHGYQLYATNGTDSAQKVTQIGSALNDANPMNFVPAGNGVVYFTADDGTGLALWRSDGTAAGTAKVNLGAAAAGLSGSALSGFGGFGYNGNLYFMTAPGDDLQWWVTNGTTTTLLKDFGTNPFPLNLPYYNVVDGKVTLNFPTGDTFPSVPLDGGGISYTWATDGTPAGTVLQQQPVTGTDSAGAEPLETAPIELANGRFLQTTLQSAPAAGIWTSDGTDSASTQLVKQFGAGTVIGSQVAIGDELYFVVSTAAGSGSSGTGALWVTNGTTSGTHPIALPSDGADPIGGIYQVGGNLMVVTLTSQWFYTSSGYEHGSGPMWLVTGTGTVTQIQQPVGAGQPVASAGSFPAGSGAGAGDQVFLSGSTLWVVSPTGATSVIDPTGLPAGFALSALNSGAPPYFAEDAAGRPANAPGLPGLDAMDAVYFDGAIYFSAANGAQHAQLWQWTVPGTSAPVVPPVSPPAIAPTVASVVINDGQAQRSMVTSITVTFNQVVDLADGAVSVMSSNATSIPVLLSTATVNGVTVLTITFSGPGVIGGSVPDGEYTLTINGAKVTDAGGTAMAGNSVTGFTRLFGDLTGNGTYDPDARWMIQDALGQTSGQPGYIAALDWNGNGVIDEADILAAVRNWGKSV